MLGDRQRKDQGDTLVEVIFSFAVFSLVIVSALVLMNQGMAMAQRSLEITLVRQQIDNQVALVRQAQEKNSQAWQDLKGPGNSRVVADPGAFEVPDVCPDATQIGLGDAAQFLGVDSGTQTVRRYVANNSTSFERARVYSRVDVRGADSGNIPKSYGIWVVLAKPENDSVSRGYDLHVRACWDSVGTDKPMAIGTLVRLYGVN